MIDYKWLYHRALESEAFRETWNSAADLSLSFFWGGFFFRRCWFWRTLLVFIGWRAAIFVVASSSPFRKYWFIKSHGKAKFFPYYISKWQQQYSAIKHNRKYKRNPWLCAKFQAVTTHIKILIISTITKNPQHHPFKPCLIPRQIFISFTQVNLPKEHQMLKSKSLSLSLSHP